MKVGILGGGQLGRMIALAGYPLGLTFRFFDPNQDSPAGQIGELIAAPYDDDAALRSFAAGLDVATYEFESVPLHAVDTVARSVPVHPAPRALAAAQDRLAERELFERLSVPVAPYAAVASGEDLRTAARGLGYPTILKTRTLGYDGKGQVRLDSDSDLSEAWEAVVARPCILERVVPFARELSVIFVRDRSGTLLTYPLIENQHSEGILRTSFAPAEVSRGLQAQADRIANAVAIRLDYIGVGAIELFDTAEGLVANEMAPRVHNSGHWTIEGAETSQFENHLRAVLSLPLGPTTPIGVSAMLNIIGRVPNLSRLLGVADAHVHLYGKSAAHRRKLGHVTVRAATAEAARERLSQLRTVLASG
jgi:5-(carboxyamino)imidazole ribonucleotide synthase